MTTTSHTNCTHPATKADRAICRTAAASGRTYDEQRSLMIRDNATTSRRAMITAKHAEPAAPVDYSTMNYEFETEECWKCAGSGQPGFLSHYAGIYGGVCFSCNKGGKNTTGRKLTRAGAAAKKIHDAWIAEHLTIRAADLQPGMKFRPNQVDGWKTVVSIDAEPKIGAYSISRDDEGNEIRTPMYFITVTTQRTSYGLSPDTLVTRTATEAERSALIAHIANRKGTILTPKN